MAPSDQKRYDDSSPPDGQASSDAAEEEERPLTVAESMFYEAADFLKWSPPTSQPQTEASTVSAPNRPAGGTLARDTNTAQNVFEEVVSSLSAFSPERASTEIGDRTRRQTRSETQVPGSFLGTSPYDASTRLINTDPDGNINRVVNPDGSIWLRKTDTASNDSGWRVFNPQGKEIAEQAFRGNVSADKFGNVRIDQTHPVPQTYLQRTDGSYVHKYSDGPTTVWDAKHSAKTVYFQDGNVQNIQFKKDDYGQPRLDHYTDKNNGTRTTLDGRGSFVTQTMDKPDKDRFKAIATEYGVTRQSTITPPPSLRDRVERAVEQTAPLIAPAHLRRPEDNHNTERSAPVFLGPVAAPIRDTQDPLGLRAAFTKNKQAADAISEAKQQLGTNSATDYGTTRRTQDLDKSKNQPKAIEVNDGVPSPGLGSGGVIGPPRKGADNITWIGANRPNTDRTPNTEFVQNGPKFSSTVSISDRVREQVIRDANSTTQSDNHTGFRMGFGKISIAGGEKTPIIEGGASHGLDERQLALLRAKLLNTDSMNSTNSTSQPWARFIQEQRGAPFTITTAPDQPPRFTIQPRLPDESTTSRGVAGANSRVVDQPPLAAGTTRLESQPGIATRPNDSSVGNARSNDGSGGIATRPNDSSVGNARSNDGSVSNSRTIDITTASRTLSGTADAGAVSPTFKLVTKYGANIDPQQLFRPLDLKQFQTVQIPVPQVDVTVKGLNQPKDLVYKQPETTIKNSPVPVYPTLEIARTFTPPKNIESSGTAATITSNTTQTFRPVLTLEPTQPLSTSRIAAIASETAQLIQPKFVQINRVETGGIVVQPQTQRTEAGGTVGQPRVQQTDVNATSFLSQIPRVNAVNTSGQRSELIGASRVEPITIAQYAATLREQGSTGVPTRGIDRQLGDLKVFTEKAVQVPQHSIESTPSIFTVKKTFAELIAPHVVIKDQSAKLTSEPGVKLTPDQIAQIRTSTIVKNLDQNAASPILKGVDVPSVKQTRIDQMLQQPAAKPIRVDQEVPSTTTQGRLEQRTLVGGTSTAGTTGTARVENQAPAPLPKPTRADQQYVQSTPIVGRAEQSQQSTTMPTRTEQGQPIPVQVSVPRTIDQVTLKPIDKLVIKPADQQTIIKPTDQVVVRSTEPVTRIDQVAAVKTNEKNISGFDQQVVRPAPLTTDTSAIWLGAKRTDFAPQQTTRTADISQAPAPPKNIDQTQFNAPKSTEIPLQSMPPRTPQQVNGTTNIDTSQPRIGVPPKNVVESTPQNTTIKGVESTPQNTTFRGVESTPQNTTFRGIDVIAQNTALKIPQGQPAPVLKNVEIVPQQQTSNRVTPEVVAQQTAGTRNTPDVVQPTGTRSTSLTAQNLPDAAQPIGNRTTSLTGQTLPDAAQPIGTRTTSVNGQPAPDVVQTTGTRTTSVNGRPAPDVVQTTGTRTTSVNGQPAPDVVQTTGTRTTSVNGQPAPDVVQTTGTRSSNVPQNTVRSTPDGASLPTGTRSTPEFSQQPKSPDMKLQPSTAKMEVSQPTNSSYVPQAIKPKNIEAVQNVDVTPQAGIPKNFPVLQQSTGAARPIESSQQPNGAARTVDIPPKLAPAAQRIEAQQQPAPVQQGTERQSQPNVVGLDKTFDASKFVQAQEPRPSTGTSTSTTQGQLDKGFNQAKLPQAPDLKSPDRTTVTPSTQRPEQVSPNTQRPEQVSPSTPRAEVKGSTEQAPPKTPFFTSPAKLEEQTGRPAATTQPSDQQRPTSIPRTTESQTVPPAEKLMPQSKPAQPVLSAQGQPQDSVATNKNSSVARPVTQPERSTVPPDRATLPTDRGPTQTNRPSQTDRPLVAQPERSVPTQADRNLTTTQAQRGLTAQPERTFPTQTGKELSVQANRTLPTAADRSAAQANQAVPQERAVAQRNPLTDRLNPTTEAQRALDATRPTTKTTATDAPTSIISRQLDARADIKDARIAGGPQSGELKVPLLQGRVSEISIVRPTAADRAIATDRAVSTDRATTTDRTYATDKVAAQKLDHIPLVQLDNRASSLRGLVPGSDQRGADSRSTSRDPAATETSKQVDAHKPGDVTIKLTRVPQDVQVATHQSSELTAVLNTLSGRRTHATAVEESVAPRKAEPTATNAPLTGRVEVRVQDVRINTAQPANTGDVRAPRIDADTKATPDAKGTRIEPAAPTNAQTAGTRFDTRVQPIFAQPVPVQDAAVTAQGRDGKGVPVDPTRVVKSTFETGESSTLTTPFKQQNDAAQTCGTRRFLTGLELAILIAAAGIVKIRPDRPYSPADATTEKQLKINQQVAFQLAVIKPIGRQIESRHVDGRVNESTVRTFRVKMHTARLDELLQQSEQRGVNLEGKRNVKSDQTTNAVGPGSNSGNDSAKTLSLMEKALSAFATKFEEATNPFSIKYKLEPMTVPYIPVPKAEYENEIKNGKDKQVEEREATDQQDKHGKQQIQSHFDRPFWLIAPGETLVGIAEGCFRDADIGWLIADLNVKNVTERWENGKRVIECQSRQKIWLPYQEEIEQFYKQSHSIADPDNLITIVIESNVDQEIITTTLELAMGLKSQGRKTLNPPADAHDQLPPMLLTNKQQSLSERIQSTLGFLNPRPQMHKHDFLAELAGTAPFSPSLRYMQLAGRRLTAADQPWYIESRQTRPE